MTFVEILVAFLGVANAILIIRRDVWNYPFGLAMVALYAVIFYEACLYADAILQIYYVAIQLLGWRWWLLNRDTSGSVVVESLSAKQRIVTVASAASACLVTGYLFSTFTDAAAPWWDSAVAGLSVPAQFLLSRRKIEAWLIWVLVDVLAIGFYASRELYATAALYSVFLVLALIGLKEWYRARRALLAEREVPA